VVRIVVIVEDVETCRPMLPGSTHIDGGSERLPLVTLDTRLAEAAKRDGFRVTQPGLR